MTGFPCASQQPAALCKFPLPLLLLFFAFDFFIIADRLYFVNKYFVLNWRACHYKKKNPQTSIISSAILNEYFKISVRLLTAYEH